MDDRTVRRYNQFTSILAFGTANAADFTPPSAVPGYFTDLQTAVTGMDEARAGQGRASATPKSIRLQALRLDIQNIHRIAVALEPTNPGLSDKLPAAGNSETALLTTAGKYAAAFLPQPNDTAAEISAKTALVALFVAHELPATFAQDIADDIAAIGEANKTMDTEDASGVEDTAALDLHTTKGIELAALIDAALRTKYARNPDKLRAWESASHLERAPQRAKKTTAVNSPPTGGAK
jgi:hypothetical protein